jgi:glycosyltransferase involved in cell wall biosynthesis
MTKVTILMTVYNGLPYVRQAVRSVLNQTLGDWRCVVVNDGSTDGTGDFLESIRDERFLVLHQENAGISVAMNNGLQHCTTQYVARLDADDIAVQTRLAEQMAYLDSHPEVGLVGTQVVPMGERRLGRSLKLPLEHDAIMTALMLGRHAVVHSSIMLRTRLLRDVGGYWTLPMGEEYDMMLRMGEVSRLANLDRVLLLYRVHEASLTNNAMRLAQFRIALACELARRRRAGLPPITAEEFEVQRQARPWWRRCAESFDIHARRQYRLAVAEMYGRHPLRGRARLGWAAMCSPRLTIERVLRIARRPAQAKKRSEVCAEKRDGLVVLAT